ncbi:MAG: AI-2E family transporter [Nanoarchaeota archaeon]|nr:AI-2E family transporter [Nanoarchaeota archaeon]
MSAVRQDEFEKYAFLVIALVLTVIAFLIIRPFIAAILGGIILAYICYPIYRWIRNKLKRKTPAALITCILLIIVLLVPTTVILNTLTKEAYVGYILSKQKVAATEAILGECDLSNTICKAVQPLNNFIQEPQVQYQIQSSIEKFTSYILDNISNIVLSIPKFLLSMFFMLFTMYYALKEGHHVVRLAQKLIPLKAGVKQKLYKKITKTTFAVVYGYIIVAIIQGSLGAIGFLIFGISSPLSWGIVMGFLALFPLIGTPIIWVPAGLLKLMDGIINNETGTIVAAIALLLYGIFIISGIDNILRPKIIGSQAKVHPWIILMGVLGGILMFGFIGLIVGPLILTTFVILCELYAEGKLTKR